MEYIAFGYIGLFVVCFLAATILPLTSEGILLFYLTLNFDPITCLVIASIGNILGGTTNYGLGLIGHKLSFQQNSNYSQRFERFNIRIKKYGASLALFSWVPIIGDPLTIALGFFKVPFIPVLIYMTIAKTLRYAIIIFLWN